MIPCNKLQLLLFFLFFQYAFIFAGFFQFVGLIGVTVGTILFTVLFLLYSILYSKFLVFNIKFLYSVIFVFYIIFLGVYRHSTFKEIVLYLFYLLIPLGIYHGIQMINDKIVLVLSWMNKISLLQLPILLIQSQYGALLGNISAKKFHAIDACFGTFPIADDHGLGMFFLVVIGIQLFFFKGRNHKKSAILLLNGVLCIFLTNSIVSKILLVLLILIYFANKFNLKFKFSTRNIILFLLVFWLIFKLTDPISFIAEKLDKGELYSLSYRESAQQIAQKNAGRFQTVVYFLGRDKLFFWGSGPFSYYNPFLNRFNVNVNFSQILWFYVDIGLIGMLMFFTWFYSLVRNLFKSSHPLGEFLLMAFFIYSFFTTALNSITILTSYYLAMSFIDFKCVKKDC